MKLDKDDLEIFKYLSSYKAISVVMMISGACGIGFGSYLIIFKGARAADMALTGASLVILASNFLGFCYIRVLEKFKNYSGESVVETICPKCGYGHVIKENISMEIGTLCTNNLKNGKVLSRILKNPLIGFLVSSLIVGLVWLLVRVIRS